MFDCWGRNSGQAGWSLETLQQVLFFASFETPKNYQNQEVERAQITGIGQTKLIWSSVSKLSKLFLESKFQWSSPLGGSQTFELSLRFSQQKHLRKFGFEFFETGIPSAISSRWLMMQIDDVKHARSLPAKNKVKNSLDFSGCNWFQGSDHFPVHTLKFLTQKIDENPEKGWLTPLRWSDADVRNRRDS